MAELEDKKAALIAKQDTARTPHNIKVHPNLAALCRRKVEASEMLLEDAHHGDEASARIARSAAA
jgi:hypothetical protein